MPDHKPPANGEMASSTTGSRPAKLGFLHRHTVSLAVAITGVGTLSYVLCVIYMCTSGIGDPTLQATYSKVAPETYQFPMIAFGTAFMLNLLTLVFERESSKFQLALVACYINILAWTNDFLSWKGMLPIVADANGNGLHIGRLVMWLHTTPSMVYLLSMLSDFPRSQVLNVMGIDALMLVLAILGHVTSSKILWLAAFAGSFAAFAYVVKNLWAMFNVSLHDATAEVSKNSLLTLRLFTVGLWFAFPATWLVVQTGALSVGAEEWLWTIGDFIGKVMFSSSLLQGNFLTLEQRKFITMRAIEEGNRIQVIQELHDLVEQKERFMSGMSHELRTPLNGIIGLSEALVMGSCGPINEAAIKTISTIKTSGARLLNLINDILDAASMRQMQGQLTIKHERVELSRISQDVIDLCQPLAKRGVTLVHSIPTDLPPVLGDTGRLIQIFHNLIGNSCKFTHTGTISISAVHKLDEVEVSVNDTGIGIPQEKFDSIFKAFEQVDMSVTRKYGGTGLGLNLVKQLVDAHGGTIAVRSKLGVGTTFFFTLKVWTESMSSQSPECPASPILGGAAGNEGRASTTKRPVRRSKPSGSISRGHLQAQSSAALPPRPSNSPLARSGIGSVDAISTGPGTPTTPDISTGAGVANTVSFLSHNSKTDKPVVGDLVSAARRRSLHADLGTRNSYDATMVSGPVPLGEAMVLARSLQKRASAKAAQQPAKLPTGKSATAQTVEDAKSAADADAGQNDEALDKISNKIHDKIHVLSVDDDPINQMVIQNLLGVDHYEITQAMDGEEALAMLKSMPELPDIILLDVMMPGISGYEVCRKMREMFPLSCVPIIMISAKGQEENIVEGLQSGSNDYVVKPFGRAEMLARISAHLRFRDDVYMAGEIAASEGDITSRVPSCLAPLIGVPAWGTSLPQGVAAALESGSGSTVQVYPLVTVLAIRITNLRELCATCTTDDVVAALASLYVTLDECMKLNGAYCVDDMAQDYISVITGLKGEADQVQQAMNIGKALLKTAAAGRELPSGFRLCLSAAVHTLPSQGVVVGTTHPVMQLTGQLPADSLHLLAIAPPGNILLSAQAAAALRSPTASGSSKVAAQAEPTSGTTAQEGLSSSGLIQAGTWRGGHLHLLDVTGAQEHKKMLQSQLNRFGHLMGGPTALATTAMRFKPVQRALMDLARVTPLHLIELGNATVAAALGKVGVTSADTSKAAQLLQAMSSNSSAGAQLSKQGSGKEVGGGGGQGSDSFAEMAMSAIAAMDAAAKEPGMVPGADLAVAVAARDLAERQLEVVSKEAERLTEQVDDLTKQLQVVTTQLNHTKTPAAGDAAPAAPAAQAGVTAGPIPRMLSKISAAPLSASTLSEMPLLASPSQTSTAHFRDGMRPSIEADADAAVRQAQLTAQLAVLEQEVVVWKEEATSAQVALNQAERRIAALQDALVRSYEADNPIGTSAAPSMRMTGSGRRLMTGSVIVGEAPYRPGSGLVRGRASTAGSIAGDAYSYPPPESLLSQPSGGSQLGMGIHGAGSGVIGSPPRFHHRPSPASVSGQHRVAGSSVGTSELVLSPEAFTDIRVLLDELGLSDLAPKFVEEQVIPSMLPHLDAVALSELGVNTLGAKLKLKVATAAIKQAQP